MGALANQLIQGFLLGGLYALFAMGLSLSVGTLRFVNIAHGDLIVLISFLLLTLTGGFGLHPIVAALTAIPIAFVGGYALQRLLLQRVVGKGTLPPILVTFGLSIIAQNTLQGLYGANTHKISGGTIEIATIHVGAGINIGVLPLIIFLTAVGMVLLLDTILYKTALGARIRAVSDDVAAAALVGLPSARIYASAMGLVAITIAVAAAFLSVWTNFDPTSGSSNLLFAFEAVVLGGLGSLWGTLVGGILLGIAQSVGAQFDAAWQVLAGHIVFLLIFLARPQGLFPR